MAKSIKLGNETYWDSKGIDYKQVNLETTLDNINSYLNGLIKIADYSTDSFAATAGNRYRGTIDITIPTGHSVISIMPTYVINGDRNFIDYNFYYKVPRIYYEIYCQYTNGSLQGNLRVVMIKND